MNVERFSSDPGRFIIKAYTYGAPSKIAPFIYSAVPIAVIIDMLFWGKYPNIWFWIGAVFIAFGGIYTMHSSAELKAVPKPENQ